MVLPLHCRFPYTRVQLAQITINEKKEKCKDKRPSVKVYSFFRWMRMFEIFKVGRWIELWPVSCVVYTRHYTSHFTLYTLFKVINKNFNFRRNNFGYFGFFRLARARKRKPQERIHNQLAYTCDFPEIAAVLTTFNLIYYAVV